MTTPEDLKYGDKILVLRHGSKADISGIQFSALEALQKDEENVFEARITSTPGYHGGFCDMDVRIDALHIDLKGLSIRRDLLIERTFTKKIKKA